MQKAGFEGADWEGDRATVLQPLEAVKPILRAG